MRRAEYPDFSSKKEKLKRVIVFTYQHKTQKKCFQKEIFKGIFEEIQKHNLLLQLEELPRINDFQGGITKPAYKPVLTDGIILITSCPEIAMQLLFSTPGLPKVIIDAVIPHSPCVVTDNFDGMLQIIKYLKKNGHKRLGLAHGMIDGVNPTNENERREAFERIVKYENLQGEMFEVDKVEYLIDIFRSQKRPSVLLFNRDDPALRFIELAEKEGFRIPEDMSVTGFDDFSIKGLKLNRLTTLKIDQFELGRRAVKMLLSFDDHMEYMRKWERVKGQLVIRNSTGFLEKGK